MTSRRPYWCPKTMKQRPCCCPKPIFWELNSFLMHTRSFVPINWRRCWPREWKHSIVAVCRPAILKWMSAIPLTLLVAQSREVKTWRPRVVPEVFGSCPSSLSEESSPETDFIPERDPAKNGSMENNEVQSFLDTLESNLQSVVPLGV